MARMRAVASVAGSGLFGEEEQETRTATIAAIRPRSECLIRPLAPHRPFSFKHRCQRRPRFLGPLLRLFGGSILARSDVGTERFRRDGNGRTEVRVTPYELCGMSKAEVQQVVEDQHLAVAIRSSADADSWRLDLGCNHGRDFPRDAFENHQSHARAIECNGVAYELLHAAEILALHFIAAHHI